MSSNDDDNMSNDMEVDQKLEQMEVKDDDDEGSDDEESSDDDAEEEEAARNGPPPFAMPSLPQPLPSSHT